MFTCHPICEKYLNRLLEDYSYTDAKICTSKIPSSFHFVCHPLYAYENTGEITSDERTRILTEHNIDLYLYSKHDAWMLSFLLFHKWHESRSKIYRIENAHKIFSEQKGAIIDILHFPVVTTKLDIELLRPDVIIVMSQFCKKYGYPGVTMTNRFPLLDIVSFAPNSSTAGFNVLKPRPRPSKQITNVPKMPTRRAATEINKTTTESADKADRPDRPDTKPRVIVAPRGKFNRQRGFR